MLLEDASAPTSVSTTIPQACLVDSGRTERQIVRSVDMLSGHFLRLHISSIPKLVILLRILIKDVHTLLHCGKRYTHGRLKRQT